MKHTATFFLAWTIWRTSGHFAMGKWNTIFFLENLWWVGGTEGKWPWLTFIDHAFPSRNYYKYFICVISFTSDNSAILWKNKLAWERLNTFPKLIQPVSSRCEIQTFVSLDLKTELLTTAPYCLTSLPGNCHLYGERLSPSGVSHQILLTPHSILIPSVHFYCQYTSLSHTGTIISHSHLVCRHPSSPLLIHFVHHSQTNPLLLPALIFILPLQIMHVFCT